MDWKIVLDIVVSILAIVGFFGGIPVFVKYINRPFIEVDDINIFKVNIESSSERGIGQTGRGYTAIRMGVRQTNFVWSLHNQKRYRFFGKEAIDVITRLSVTNHQTGETFLSCKLAPLPLLSVPEKFEQRFTKENEIIPDDEYNLTFIIESKNEKPISKTKYITINGEKTTIN